MVWNVHPHFIRSSSGFVAAEGGKKAVHAMATTEGSAVPIAGQTQHKVLSGRRQAQWQQLTFLAVAFKSGLTASRTLCFCSAPSTQTLILSKHWLVASFGEQPPGLHSELPKESVLTELKSPPRIFLREMKQLWGGEDSCTQLPQIQLCCVSMLCQNSHKRQLLRPKHVQRKGEKKKPKHLSWYQAD